MSTIKPDIRDLFQRLYYWKLYGKGVVGKNVRLSRHGTVVNPQEIEIGDNVFISEYFHISAYRFRIGRDVIIGPRLLAVCNNHVYKQVGATVFDCASDKAYEPIAIESDVWLGGNVTLLPGVTVGQGCVVGAGSVVSRSLPPYTVCVGVPCKPIKTRFTEFGLIEHLKTLSWNKLSAKEVLDQWEKFELK